MLCLTVCSKSWSCTCRVIAWEPVPLYRAHLALAVALNNVSDLVEVRPAAVSDLPVGSTVGIGVPKKGVYRSSASVDKKAIEDHEGRAEGSPHPCQLGGTAHQ